MAWPALDVDTLPLILAGPVLRKVSTTSVSVWVALSKAAQTYLSVKKGSTNVAFGDVVTTPIGKHLHLAFLTATTEGTDLKPGVIYGYELTFMVGTKKYTLATATNSAELTYPQQSHPTFVLPPDDLEKVRIIHGSCRKPHGQSTDAFEILDDLIMVASDDPDTRPHLAVLSGDQIYADDVADVLLPQISEAAKFLMGYEETVKDGSDTKAVGGVGLGPGKARSKVVKDAGSTSQDVTTQLMSLGEYMAMYLFAWSDVFWPTTELTGEKHVEHYRKALRKVRRALANIPSYMMMDDHEVTDDFNMSKKFCEGIYGTAMGKRIIQNGLVAFTLCQAWGNNPDLEISRITSGLVGVDTASLYEQASFMLAPLVGVEDKSDLARRSPYGVGHLHNGMDFHFTVEGKAFQIIVTDTRTYREFPGYNDDDHSTLIPEGIMNTQIDRTPALGDRVLIVVVTTNAPPIASFRLAAAHPSFADPHENDTIDSWDIPAKEFDQLIVHLTNKFDPDASGNRSGRAVLLSGDVHFSFATRLQYWADKRLGDTTKADTKAVFAQLIASALKNEKDDTRGLHKDGYRYVPDMNGKSGSFKDYVIDSGIEWFANSIVPEAVPEEFAGWDVTSTKRVGKTESGGSVAARVEQPTVKIDPDMVFNTAPDYRYRLDYLETAAASSYPGDPPTIPELASVLSGGSFAIAGYYLAAMAYRDYTKSPGKARQIVGKNNIGEISFEWGSGNNKKVHHTLRWREKDQIKWARYAISLSLDSATYPKPKLPGVD